MDINATYNEIFNPFKMTPAELEQLRDPEQAAKHVIRWFFEHPYTTVQSVEKDRFIDALKKAIYSLSGITWEDLMHGKDKSYYNCDWRGLAWYVWREHEGLSIAKIADTCGHNRTSAWRLIDTTTARLGADPLTKKRHKQLLDLIDHILNNN